MQKPRAIQLRPKHHPTDGFLNNTIRIHCLPEDGVGEFCVSRKFSFTNYTTLSRSIYLTGPEMIRLGTRMVEMGKYLKRTSH